MNRLIAILQAAPLGCQEVRDHECLAFAFGLWHWPAGLLSPYSLAAVVLIKCGLVVGDEDESEWGTIRDWESVWAWEFMSIIIKLVEALLASFPPFNKLAPIFYDILPLVAVDVHPISNTFISPIQFLQPAGGRFFRDRRLANALLREGLLHFGTCDEINEILRPQESFFRLLHHLQFDFACNVLITKDCPSRVAQAMERKIPGLQELQGPLADAPCMSVPKSLSFRNGH
jgi:hypothetical protein